MGNIKMISKIYSNLNELTDSIERFPETAEAVDRFYAYVKEKLLDKETGKSNEQWIKLEDVFLDVTLAYEQQGFIWGVQYALDLFTQNGSIEYLHKILSL